MRDCSTGCGTDGSICGTSHVLTLLRADTVGVDLSAEQLGAGVVVADHAARGARMPLHAVTRGSEGKGTLGLLEDFAIFRSTFLVVLRPPLRSAGDLPGEDVECLGGGEARAAVAVGHRHRVRGGRPELHIHWHQYT